MEKIICKETSVYAMSKDNPPVCRAKPGETLVFESFDCMGGQITCEENGVGGLDWDAINPASGPVYVEGAEPGDALKVEVLQIELAPTGLLCALPGNGIFGDEVTEETVRIVPIRDGAVEFAKDLRLPLDPMIGVIGVAPAGEAVACGTPGPHGGNMDNTRIGPGAVLYLPVFQLGALLAMGDVHACMGDGEIMVSGVETAARITVRIDLIKGVHLPTPVLERGDKVYVIASAPSLEKAIHDAARYMLELVRRSRQLSFNEAGMLLSAVGDAQVCQIVDPQVTARYALPRWILKEGNPVG